MINKRRCTISSGSRLCLEIFHTFSQPSDQQKQPIEAPCPHWRDRKFYLGTKILLGTFNLFMSASDLFFLLDFLNCNCAVLMRAKCACVHGILTRTNLGEGCSCCCSYHVKVKSNTSLCLDWEFNNSLSCIDRVVLIPS